MNNKNLSERWFGIAAQFLGAAAILADSSEAKTLFRPTLLLTAQGIEALLKANLIGAGLKIGMIKNISHDLSKSWHHDLNKNLQKHTLAHAERVWEWAKKQPRYQDERWSRDFGPVVKL